MTNQPIPSLDSKNSLNPLTEELLDVLLEADESYLWDPTDPNSEDYFRELEAEFPLIDALDESEITAQANTFFSRLHQCWPSEDDSHLPNSVLDKFSQMVPKTWLETIVTQAEMILTKNLSQLNQVVECVKPLWTDWAEEDLLVFARPFTYPMRGETKVKRGYWQELSEIEQIRFSMAIAKEVLGELTPQ